MRPTQCTVIEWALRSASLDLHLTIHGIVSPSNGLSQTAGMVCHLHVALPCSSLTGVAIDLSIHNTKVWGHSPMYTMEYKSI